ncbi:MAG: alpha/beta hydrolase family protein [Actinomycetota bacterium]
MPKLISILAVMSLAAIFPGEPAPTSLELPRIEDGIVIPSFDGEPIVGTLMLPADASVTAPVPVVLRTHGWGQRRLREPDPFMQRLLDSGYGLFTWDSRGFGHSGGEANWGTPDFEVRDASAVIDYLATRPEIEKELPGDPKLGWIGASNAGGVQLNTAAADDRVDAIVPQHSWGSLLSDLMPNGVYREGWVDRLYWRGLDGAREDGLESDNPAGPQEGDYAERFHDAHESWNTTGKLSRELKDWFLERSTIASAPRIAAPTMIVHGAIDTLFPLQGALSVYRELVSAGTPVKLLVYCSGHTLDGCPYPGGRSGYPNGTGDSRLWEGRIVAWLDRYVQGDDSVATGPRVEWQGPDGYYYAAPSFPLGGTRYLASAPWRTDALRGPLGQGGDTATDAGPVPADQLGNSATRHRVLGPYASPRPIFGVPKVTVSGRLRGATKGVIQLELVDEAPDGTRVTVNNQSTPVRLHRGENSLRVRMAAVAWVLRPGHELELELTTGSPMFRADAGEYTVRLRLRARIPVAPARWVSAEART